MRQRGKLITLEGVDGAGKSTHVEFIADALRTKARHVVVTREPGGTELAERLRDAILGQAMQPDVETLLLFAARADHVAKVIGPALEAGGWVPLMYAARQNAQDALRALAEAGANLNATDPDNMTALLVAIINAHYDAAALLLDMGADPNIGDVVGMTPLYAAVDMNTFPDTPGRPTPKPSGGLDAVDMVRALLSHGADANATLNAPILVRVHDRGDGTLAAGATPLMRAAKKGDVEIMRVLLTHGADPTRRTRAGTEALMFAAGLGGAGRFTAFEDKQATDADFIEAAALCLDGGANIDAVNDTGQTALHLAVAVRSDTFIKFLTDRGARVDIRDKQGRTPLDVASGVGARGRGGEATPVRASVVALLRQLMGPQMK